ncbi:NTP transferase domain-containing protein [Acidisoma sp. 7E03]
MSAAGFLTVLVLAGSRQGAADPMAIAAQVSHKALLPIAGTPMLLRVIRALRATPAVGRIILSCERTDLLDGRTEAADVITIRAEASPAASVAAALRDYGTPLLVTTADHALLSPAILADFLAQAPQSADAIAAVARAEVVRAGFPETRRTWIRLRDGDFSGCNLFLLRHPRAASAVAFWRRLEHERKRPLAMARLIGPRALLAYLLRLLTLDGAARLLSRRVGATLAAIPLSHADAAIDVDKPADLDLVEKTLAARAAA